MMILAIDLGQSKSVACVYDTESHTHRFTTIRITAQEVHDLIVEKITER